MVVDEVLDGAADAAVGHGRTDQRWQVQHRAGEDDRDHARLVDLQRDVGALAAVHAPAHHPFGELHGDAALALLHEDDAHHQDQGHHHETGQGVVAVVGSDLGELGRQRRHDAGEDEQRHAVADAALGDQLPHPHQQGGARGEGQDNYEHGPHREVGQQVDPAHQGAAVEQECEAGRLEKGDADGEVARPLGDLALAHRTLLLPLLDAGDHHTEDLHDDRGRDVGHDPQREDGELGERAAREQLHEPEDPTRRVGLVPHQLHGVGIDVGRGDEGAQAVYAEDEQREEDLVAQIRDAEHVQHAVQHGQPSPLSGWCAGCSCRGAAGGRPRAWR